MRSLAAILAAAMLAGCGPNDPQGDRQLARQCLFGGDLYLIQGRLWKVPDWPSFERPTLVAPGINLDAVCVSILPREEIR